MKYGQAIFSVWLFSLYFRLSLCLAIYARAVEHESGSTDRQAHSNLLQDRTTARQAARGILFFIRGTNRETRKHLRVVAVRSCQKRTGKCVNRSDTLQTVN